MLGAVSDMVLPEQVDYEFGFKLTLKWLRLHLDHCAFLPVRHSLGTTELCHLQSLGSNKMPKKEIKDNIEDFFLILGI